MLDIKNDEGCCWLTLDRPDSYNALDTPLLKELFTNLNEIAQKGNARCLVLTGNGKGFCTGADVAEWASAEAQGRLESYAADWNELAHEIMKKLYSLPIPTIAAINGAAVGAGVDLSMCCDFRYASTRAKFKAGYTSMAYPPDAGSSWHLPRLIGEDKTRQFLFFDDAWNAQQAFNAGLVSKVCEEDELIKIVSEDANRLANGPTFAYGATKSLLEKSRYLTFQEQLNEERLAATECGRTHDAEEAIKAATEKRSPQFTGR